MEDDPVLLKMEEDINFWKIEDDLNFEEKNIMEYDLIFG
jgi:hypothetical protein